MTANPGNNNSSTVSRRTVAKGIAWAAPAITFAGAAPALAMSLRKDPGINGWVLNTHRGGWRCSHALEVNSNITNRVGDDGAPFGLYLYDIDDDSATVSNARLTYWIIGDQRASWETYRDHSECWGSRARHTADKGRRPRLHALHLDV